jgi:hypothetical protein
MAVDAQMGAAAQAVIVAFAGIGRRGLRTGVTTMSLLLFAL